MEENKKIAWHIVNQLFDMAEVPVEKRQAINDRCDDLVHSIIQSQLTEKDKENERLNNALLGLYREIRGRFTKDEGTAFTHMSEPLSKIMQECKEVLKSNNFNSYGRE